MGDGIPDQHFVPGANRPSRGELPGPKDRPARLEVVADERVPSAGLLQEVNALPWVRGVLPLQSGKHEDRAMKPSFTWTLMLAIFAIGAAALADARDAPRKSFNVLMEAMDHNGDKMISEFEFTRNKTGHAKDRAKKEFKRLDTNGDGKLHMKEFGKP